VLENREKVSEFFIYWVIFLLVFTTYLLTLAPSVTSEDSGELISAAYSLGIPHPPGYPLWTSLGKIFCLFPLGSVPFRCNLFSAFFASLTILIIYKILFRLTKERYIAISCALIFAFSPMMWSQSVITEVYALHSFLYSLIIDRFLIWMDAQKSEDFILFSFLLGLGIANHHLILTLVPAIVLGILLVQPQILKEKHVILQSFFFFLLGLSLYLYLPIRSLKNPGMDWGNPENLKNFMDHVLRKQYGVHKSNVPFTLDFFLERLKIVFIWLKEQFSIPFVLIGVAGVYFSLVKEKRKSAFLAIAYIMGSVGLTLALNFNLGKEQLSDVSVFFLTSYIPFILFIGLGLAGTYKWIKRYKYGKGSWGIFLLFMPLWFLSQNLPKQNESGNYLSLDYARNILRETEADAILFSSGDQQIFPLQYLQIVERRRPDVTLCFEDGDLSKSLQYLGYNESKSIDNEAQNQLILDFLKKGIPIYFPKKRSIFSGYRLIPASLNFKVVSGASPLRFENHSQFFTKPDERSLDWIRYPDALTLATYHYFEGLRLHEQSNNKLAVQEIEQMVSFVGDAKESLNNAASTFAEWGYYDKAEHLFLKAISINSNYVMAKNNLGIMYAGNGKWRDAAIQWTRSLRIKENQQGIKKRLEEAGRHLSPIQEFSNQKNLFSFHFERGLSSLRAGETKEGVKELRLAEKSGNLTKERWNNLGSAYVEFRFFDQALICYKKALSIDSRYLKAKNNLALIHLEKRDIQKALPLLKESLQINPNQPQVKEKLRSIQEEVSKEKR